MVAKEKARFPKVWHGGLLIALGPTVGLLGAGGLLGGMRGTERDIDTGVFFLFGGFCIALLGLILLIWGARRSLRSDALAGAPDTPRESAKASSQRDESSTLQKLFLVTITAVLLGASGKDCWWLLHSTGSPFHPLSPSRKIIFFSSVYLLTQLPFLVSLVRLREKVDRLAVHILFAYSCVSVAAGSQMLSYPSYLFSWKSLLSASQIALAVVAWQARNRLPRRDGESSLLLACLVVSLLYHKLYFWLNPLIYFRF